MDFALSFFLLAFIRFFSLTAIKGSFNGKNNDFTIIWVNFIALPL
jgi:hypothetical protein